MDHNSESFRIVPFSYALSFPHALGSAKVGHLKLPTKSTPAPNLVMLAPARLRQPEVRMYCTMLRRPILLRISFFDDNLFFSFLPALAKDG